MAGQRSEAQAPREGGGGVSKTEVLKFGLPALGIYLANPLMTNVDNAFVGRFGGTADLAAISPGGVLANNLVFLFASMLNSATTGLVSRAWSGGEGDAAARTRTQLARTLNVAWAVGLALTLFYSVASHWAIRAMGTPPELIGKATLYARITGAASWATISQGVCLSALLSTRDAVTPLRVVLSAQLANLVLDFLLCCWPVRAGIAGAATATSLSTVLGFCLMARALVKRKLFPKPRLPSMRDVAPVFEYAGPIFVISAARVIGFSYMAVTAASLGTSELAAYQVIVSLFIVFVFVSGPISQSAQTLLPALIDAKETKPLRRSFKNLLVLAIIVSAVTSALYYMALSLGVSAFTSDVSVMKLVARASVSSIIPLATLLVLGTVDGAMTAAKDFRIVICYQLVAVMVQLVMLAAARTHGWGISFIFLSFSVRLWICGASAATCIIAGVGRLGKAMALTRR